MVAVGGDGSLAIAKRFADLGLPVVGVPKTIDNDLERRSRRSASTAPVQFATECIDRLHSTAESHRRILVVEVMGRYAGWIALHCGLAGHADAILIPESAVRHRVGRGAHRGGAATRRSLRDRRRGGGRATGRPAPTSGRGAEVAEARLGGSAEQVAAELRRLRRARDSAPRRARPSPPRWHSTALDRMISGCAVARRPFALVGARPASWSRSIRRRCATFRSPTRGAHEGGATRLRHGVHRPRARHLPRRRGRVKGGEPRRGYRPGLADIVLVLTLLIWSFSFLAARASGRTWASADAAPCSLGAPGRRPPAPLASAAAAFASGLVARRRHGPPRCRSTTSPSSTA